MFNERKAAQVAAWFLKRQGGRMPHLKLIKIMYLADREAMNRHGFPITGDQFVAMPHGPVPSATLDCINGYQPKPIEGGWEAWISDREGHAVALRRPDFDRGALDELSDADLDVLSAVWEKFGAWDQWKLVEYLHDPETCPEWIDPDGTSVPISYERIFEALGRSKNEAASLADRIESENTVDRLFASL
jgi:uncharacterized phage-associated protein